MRRAKILSMAAAAVVSTGLLALPAPASAATPVLTGVSLSTPAVSVRGLALASVTVTVTAKGYDDRCTPSGVVGGVFLQRTTPGWDRSAPDLLLAPMSCV